MSETGLDADKVKAIVEKKWNDSVDELTNRLEIVYKTVVKRIKLAIENSDFEPLNKGEFRIELKDVDFSLEEFNNVFSIINKALAGLKIVVKHGSVYPETKTSKTLTMRLEILE